VAPEPLHDKSILAAAAAATTTTNRINIYCISHGTHNAPNLFFSWYRRTLRCAAVKIRDVFLPVNPGFFT
jgi:hypothetical protein